MRRLASTGAAALAFLALWLLWHPVLPQTANSDLFTHLSVAQHLMRGEGFLNDIVYPLSLAFDFARQIPQPLLHRGPAYPVLLILPASLGGSDPAAVLAAVHLLHAVLLALMAWAGTTLLGRTGRLDAAPAWLLLLMLNPLLAMSAGWGQIEIPTALIMLLLWTRWSAGGKGVAWGPGSGRADLRRGIADGALAGALGLLRLDLFWVPLFWCAWPGRRLPRIRMGVAIAVWALMLAPWAVRNARLTGQPLFTLQAHAEHLKQTPEWPDYSIYRSLAPQSITTTMAQRPVVMLAKARAGARFFLSNLGRWLPWSVWIVCAGLVWIGRRRPGPERAGPGRQLGSPLPLLLMTSGLLMAQYAFFSHTVRHLVVVLPLLSLELARSGGEVLASWRGRWPLKARAVILALSVLATHLVTPMRLPGWQNALAEARDNAAQLPEAVRAARALPPGPVFTDSAALLWHTGRAGVWLPLNQEVEAEIRARVPAMRTAPVILSGSWAAPASMPDLK